MERGHRASQSARVSWGIIDGIRSDSFLVPVVNIGARQQGRLHDDNVVHVDYHADGIAAAIRKQIAHGAYRPSEIYHRQNASQAVVDVLCSAELYTQKRFHEAAPAATLSRGL